MLIAMALKIKLSCLCSSNLLTLKQFDMDFEDSDDDILSFTKLSAGNRKAATTKKASSKPVVAESDAPLKPDPNRVLQSLVVNNDNLNDIQSFDSPSTIKKKDYKATKKYFPKKKAASIAKAKILSKKKAPTEKLNKNKNKSVCNLSSDESSMDDFLSDGSVSSDVESDETGDVVMSDCIDKPSGRRTRGKVTSYADAQSSDEEFDGEEIEFD